MPEAEGTPKLHSLSESPPNAEGRFPELLTPITGTDAFYIRSNFPTPTIDPETFRLDVAGTTSTGGRATALSLADLRSLGPVLTRVVTLECAGNGRTLLTPRPDGTPWTLGAVGTASFTGVPLSAVLPGLDTAEEVLFTGSDRGVKPGRGQIAFQRSLPADHLARTRGTVDEPLLAWAMNDAPLTADHGAPLRLIVPGWYAVASVKWLARIELLDVPFDGYFQVDRYRYLRPDEPPEPVTTVRVRSLVLQVGDVVPDSPAGTDGPPQPARLRPGTHVIRGFAWSGDGPVRAVDVSTDGGATWREARLEPPDERHARTAWSIEWTARPGVHMVTSRAQDAAGNVQPTGQAWNALGYGNNVVHRVAVRVGPAPGRG